MGLLNGLYHAKSSDDSLCRLSLQSEYPAPSVSVALKAACSTKLVKHSTQLTNNTTRHTVSNFPSESAQSSLPECHGSREGPSYRSTIGICSTSRHSPMKHSKSRNRLKHLNLRIPVLSVPASARTRKPSDSSLRVTVTSVNGWM